MKNVLVLGGTGTTDRRIARRLSADGLPVRTASRTGGDVRFDLDDPTTWAPALDGVTALLDRFVTEAAAAGCRA
ncbi:hypothetical protein ACFYS8_35395 [Kitasatospora sp. NPDC004615]|uniref:hypothetical protein n=1 Tax=unclassified Kitasatospora TaxID=2633591 RepID=UPI0036D07AED